MNLMNHNSRELYHFGIPGMKWYQRRYQNEDGTLTAAGKKKYSKMYKKERDAGQNNVGKNFNRLYVEAYNRSADYMNNGGIKKFNSDQERKYGKDYTKREGYTDDYDKEFTKLLNENFDKTLADFMDNDPHFKAAKNLVEKYSMTEWDAFAKKNSEIDEELRKK